MNRQSTFALQRDSVAAGPVAVPSERRLTDLRRRRIFNASNRARSIVGRASVVAAASIPSFVDGGLRLSLWRAFEVGTIDWIVAGDGRQLSAEATRRRRRFRDRAADRFASRSRGAEPVTPRREESK